jgi:hypothetical protein
MAHDARRFLAGARELTPPLIRETPLGEQLVDVVLARIGGSGIGSVHITTVLRRRCRYSAAHGLADRLCGRTGPAGGPVERTP